jgi:O-antigen/teichoic acid export membrane protein
MGSAGPATDRAEPQPAPRMREHIGRLGRNTAIYGTGQVLLRMVSLLLLPLYTSYLTPADYGISAILGVMTYFLTPIFALGISGALGLVYFGHDDRVERGTTIWSAFATVAISAAVLAVGGWLASDGLAELLFVAGSSEYDLSYLVSVALATAALSITAQPLLARFQFEERAKGFVAITLGSSALSIGLSVLLIVGLRRGVAGFIEAAFIAQLLTLLVASTATLREVRFRVRRGVARELLGLGVPLIPGFLAIFVMLQANKLLLQAEAGLDELGLYTVGFNIGLLMTLLVTGFTTAWFPFFSSFMQRQDEARPLFARVASYYVLGAGSISLMFFIGAQPLIRLVTQPDFAGAYISVGPSAAAQFLIGLHSILLAGMYFAKAVRPGVVIQGAAAVTSVGLNLVLIPMLGAGGAALALVLGFASMVVYQHAWNIFRLHFRVPYEWGRLGVFAAVYVGTAALFLWDHDLPLVAEFGLSAIAALGVVGIVLALLSPSERSQALVELRRRLRRVVGPAS